MRSNQWIFLGIAAIVIIYAVKVYAGTVTLQTYYPAPTGYYDAMKVNKQLVLPCYSPSNIAVGTLATSSIWIQDFGCP